MDEQSLSFRLLAILFPIFGIVAAGFFYARKHKPGRVIRGQFQCVCMEHRADDQRAHRNSIASLFRHNEALI